MTIPVSRVHLPRLRSLNVLVVAGFALVALPLAAAIIVTTTFVNRLGEQSETVVEASARAARNAQMITGQIVALERNARQFSVLGTPELRTLYEERHAQLLQLIARLRSITGDRVVASRLRRLADEAEQLLLQVQAPRSAQAPAPPSFDELGNRGQAVVDAVNDWIDSRLDNLQRNADGLQRLLFWQAAGVIPLAVLLAALFTVLIGRPVRALGTAIRQLGEGGLNRPVRIRGPLDLERLGLRLDWLRRRLTELEQEKNKFLSHMSHELKTPLANIREGAELLRDGSVGQLNHPQQEVAGILRENSIQLQQSIEGLLQFNNWRDRQTRLSPQTCDLQALIGRVIERHRLQLARERITVERELHAGHVIADMEQLTVMLDNLLSNAIKYSPRGGRILIRTGRQDGWVFTEVADQGPGIPADEREKVFEAFYQGRSRGRGHLRGTGIGLAVVRECARAHGGDIELLDGEFTGAHLRIRLPEEPEHHEN